MAFKVKSRDPQIVRKANLIVFFQEIGLQPASKREEYADHYAATAKDYIRFVRHNQGYADWLFRAYGDEYVPRV